MSGLFGLSLGRFGRRVSLRVVLVEEIAQIAIQRHPARCEQRYGACNDTAITVVWLVHQFVPTLAPSDAVCASSIKEVWGKDIIFAVAPLKAAKRQVSLGYRFQQFGSPRRVFKNPITNPPNGIEVLVDDSYEFCIGNAKAAFLIKNAVE